MTGRQKRSAVRVGCGLCNWRGKRVPGECNCYDEYAMYCSCLWGKCPKCGAQIASMDTLKLQRRIVREANRREPHAR